MINQETGTEPLWIRKAQIAELSEIHLKCIKYSRERLDHQQVTPA